MPEDKKHLEELSHFIRDNRGAEQNFQKLYDRLQSEYKQAQGGERKNNYAEILQTTIEKHAETYKQNKEKGISTWAEFENFVSHFEKAVTETLRQQ